MTRTSPSHIKRPTQKRKGHAITGDWGRAPPGPTPRWAARSGGGGELWLRGAVIQRLRHDARRQLQVVEALEKGGWPTWIANPLPPSPGLNRKKALRNAVWKLNRGQGPLRVRFHVDDGGVRWEIVA